MLRSSLATRLCGLRQPPPLRSLENKLANFRPRFKVRDEEIGTDDLAAWACVRLDRLLPGYRFIHVFDANGQHSRGVLLVKIEKSMV